MRCHSSICTHPLLIAFPLSVVLSLRSIKRIILLTLLETRTSAAASGDPLGDAGFPACTS